MPFIKTFLYCYFSEVKGKKKVDIPDVRLPDSPMLEGEMDDPIEKGNFTYDASKVFTVDRTGMVLPEYADNKPDGDERVRYELHFPSSKVMDACRKYGATPVILLSIMMQRAIRSLNADEPLPVMANVVCDLREALEVPNTFRDSVSSVYLPYTREEEGKSLNDVCSHYRQLLASQRSVDSLRANAANSLRKLSEMLAGKDLGQKQAITGMISGVAPSTFVMSYLGRMDLGSVDDEIDSLQIYTSSTNGMTLEIVALENRFCVGIQQSFRDDRYVQAFMCECLKVGIPIESKSSPILFSTPRDRSGKGIINALLSRIRGNQ